MKYEDRYLAKRVAGISPIRKDGSLCHAEVDRQAGAAEQFACEQLGLEYNDEVYYTHGDGGTDAKGYSLDIKWLGFQQGTIDAPRLSGHLIVNPNEPQRWARYYVVVAGTIEEGFRLIGWTTHEELITRPTKNFGYGPKYAMHTSELNEFRKAVA